MRRGDHNIFRHDGTKLFALTSFRRNGWSIRSLSLVFQCDASSIRYQFDKLEVVPLTEEIYYFPDIISSVIQFFPIRVDQWRISNGERVNIGHTYKEYLELSSHYPPRS